MSTIKFELDMFVIKDYIFLEFRIDIFIMEDDIILDYNMHRLYCNKQVMEFNIRNDFL